MTGVFIKNGNSDAMGVIHPGRRPCEDRGSCYRNQ